MQLSPTAADAGVKTAGRTLLSLSMNGHLLNVVKCGHGSLPTSKKLISFFLFLLMLLLCLPALTSRPLARLWVDHNPPDMEKLRKKSGGLGGGLDQRGHWATTRPPQEDIIGLSSRSNILPPVKRMDFSGEISISSSSSNEQLWR